MILMEYTQDEDVLLAAILHDTLEDTDYTKEQMEADLLEYCKLDTLAMVKIWEAVGRL